MKISLVSDLHLEFGYQELPGGEVLILAGDVAEARSISKHHHSTKIIQDTPDEFYRCSEFFKFECAKYDKVFYVMGNHEHYHNRLDKTREILESVMPKNVTILENDYVVYKDVVFLGATLWTDCNKNDPISIQQIRHFMNDFRVIKNQYSDNVYAKLTPEHTIGVHRKTLEYFKKVLESNSDKPAVVITHHGPSYLSIHERYKNEYLVNGAYVSDLGNFILDHPNVKYWVHGHVHSKFHYEIGDTQVLTNPRGYVGHEDTSDFDPGLSFEI